jgi:NADH-quinone oxidoreductase subunit L
MAFLGIVQNDIKRVIAYSTLSQLGYMTVALGVSAYSAAIFHLTTHAFFKALLFLCAGSVIIALHHEQDMRKMGGLAKYMPITWVTAIIGSLALAGVPPFAGFFSKDAIIEAVHLSQIPGHGYAYFAVMSGVFVTAFYSFRLLFLTFHGNERFRTAGHEDAEHAHDASSSAGAEPGAHPLEGAEPKESPWVVTVPLILLAIPSIYTGWVYIEPMLFGDYYGSSIVVLERHAVLKELSAEWHGVGAFIMHGLLSAPFWLAVAGIVAAWYCYLINPALPARLQKLAGGVYTLLDNKYYFDKFNDWFFAGGTRKVGAVASNIGDRTIIDGWMVNGSARLVGWTSSLMRQLQTGYIYHYALSMVIGIVALLTWWVVR